MCRLCLVQDDGLISFRNQRYVQICGYTAKDVPDTETWWQRAFPDARERDAVRKVWLDAERQSASGEGVIPMAEYTIRCADGSLRPVEVSGVIVDGGRLITINRGTAWPGVERSRRSRFMGLRGIANACARQLPGGGQRLLRTLAWRALGAAATRLR